MKQRPRVPRDSAGLDRQTGQLLAGWFAERAPLAAPPTLMAAVHARVGDTARRSGWRIRDRWLWRPPTAQRTGFLAATATAVLVLALTGLGSAGVYLLASVGEVTPLVGAPGAALASPADAVASADVTATVAATTPPSTANVQQRQSTTVAGSLLEAPSIVAEGVQTADGPDVSETVGFVTSSSVQFDDARLTGTQRETRNERRYRDVSESAVATGTLAIENAGGAWRGTFVSISPPGREGSLQQAELAGEGDYAGLSAILRYDLGEGWGDPAMITGVVQPGSLPDYPDAGGFDRYAPYWEGPARPGPAEGDAADATDLPLYVTGSSTQTIEWMSDDLLYGETSPQMQLQPQWMVAGMALDDARLQMDDYETLVNADYFVALENGAAMTGISRGSAAGGGGGWTGRLRGYADPDDEYLGGQYALTELTGVGGNDGLTAVLLSRPRAAGTTEYLLSWSVEGMLFRGQLPPYPEGP